MSVNYGQQDGPNKPSSGHPSRGAVLQDHAVDRHTTSHPLTHGTTHIGISWLVGRAVTFTPRHGSTHHGVVVKATYSMLGEPILVIHPDDEPVAISADLVLFGSDAAALVAALTGGHAPTT